MTNLTAVSLSRAFYRKPRGGYPKPNPGAISIKAPRVIVRPKGSKATRPAHNQIQ